MTHDEIIKRYREIDKVKQDRRMAALDEVRRVFEEEFRAELNTLQEACGELGHAWGSGTPNMFNDRFFYNCYNCGKSAGFDWDDKDRP